MPFVHHLRFTVIHHFSAFWIFSKACTNKAVVNNIFNNRCLTNGVKLFSFLVKKLKSCQFCNGKLYCCPYKNLVNISINCCNYVIVI